MRVYATGPAGKVVDTVSGVLHYFNSRTNSNWPGGTLDLGTVAIPLAKSGAFNIYDTITRGYLYADRREGTAPLVRCRWQSGSLEGTVYDGCVYGVYGKDSDLYVRCVRAGP